MERNTQKYQDPTLAKSKAHSLVRALKWVLFPWQIWLIAGYIANWFVSKRYLHKGPATLLRFMVFLPLSLVLMTEVLICAHGMILGEQEDYRLVSDGFVDYHERSFPQFGPPVPEIPPVDQSLTDREAYYQYLVELYSPVIFHKISHHPEYCRMPQ